MNENGDEENRQEDNPVDGEGKDKASEEPKYEEFHLKTVSIPAIVMLTAGAATSIMAFLKHFPVMQFLQLVLCSMLLFWFIGGIAKLLLDRIVIRKEIPPVIDGTVTEKPLDRGEDAGAAEAQAG
ncbi:MAG: hypothetical protein J6P05_04790 [Lachnospiraceae bacterium]|nr:hypothetical protein [Lachnospiraceae bacterium]